MVSIHTFATGINPVEFQVDLQEDYVDLSLSLLLRTGTDSELK